MTRETIELGHDAAVAARRPSLRRRPAPRAQAPRSAGGEAGALGVSPIAITSSRRGRRRRSPRPRRRGAGGQVLGDGLDRVAAVEVGGVGGDRALDLRRSERCGRALAAEARGSPRGQADLLSLGASLAQALRGQVALLGPARRQGRDLTARAEALAGGLEDLLAAGGEGAQVLGRSPRSPRSFSPPASGRRGAGSARGAGWPRRCSRRSWRGRRSPGGRAGSSAVRPLGRVGDEDVGMELGVAGPAGAVG